MIKDNLTKEDLEILYDELPVLKNYDLEETLDGTCNELELRYFENAKEFFDWIFDGYIDRKIADLMITENFLNKTFAEGYVESLENTIKLTNGKYIFMFV